jgi:hypothetical protein
LIEFVAVEGSADRAIYAVRGHYSDE